MAIDPEIKAQLQAEAAQALNQEDGTATVQETPEEVTDSEPVHADVTADEEVTETTETQPETTDDTPTKDQEDDLDEDIDIVDESEKPKSNRARERIRQLNQKWREAEIKNAVLEEKLRLQGGTPAQKAASDEKLLQQGYTPEQIAEGKKFLESLGYLSADEVKAMKERFNALERDKLLQADQQELQQALAKTKIGFTEKQVMDQVAKWANHPDPKIQARASMDYAAIISLMSKKTAPAKPNAPAKKIAPAVPKGGGETVKTVAPKSKDLVWDPGDRIGSRQRFVQAMHESVSDE